MPQLDKRRLWWVTITLLIGAAWVIPRADDLTLWVDETWTIFQTQGTVEQMLLDPDVTWPPGHYFLVYFWQRIATNNDFVLHVLGCFLGIIGAALMYRAGKRLGGESAGSFTALAFSTSGFAIYFMLEQRGYGMMLMTVGGFVWAYLRWLAMPNFRRSAWLTISQVAMLYTHFISGAIIVLAVVHLITVCLFFERARLWERLARFVIISLVTGIAFLPILPQFLRGLSLRSGIPGETPGYLLGDMSKMVRAYSGTWDVPFLILFALALVGWIWPMRNHSRNQQRHVTFFGFLLLWGVGIPFGAYLFQASVPYFSARYLSFTMSAVFILIGVGIARLPDRRLVWAAAMLLVIVAFAPWQQFEHRPKYSDDIPHIQAFVRELARNWRVGDVMVIDPNCICLSDPIAWWYYEYWYFPGGEIPRAEADTSAQRVWYISHQERISANVAEQIANGRMLRQSFGEWYFLTQLYEGPPKSPSESVVFGDAVILRGAEVERRPLLHVGDSLSVSLWWQTKDQISADYSVSLRIVDAQGEIIAQNDRAPQGEGIPSQMTEWIAGQLYRETRVLTLPYRLYPGQYTIEVVVYDWRDGSRLSPQTSGSQEITASNSVIIDHARLVSHSVWWR